MSNRLWLGVLSSGLLALGMLPGSPAEACPPSQGLVSTSWLADHLDRDDLVIVDIRPSDQYAAGHVPNAVNVPFEMPISAWTSMNNGLLMELPDRAALFSTLGAAGIREDSWVVVANVTEQVGVPAAYPLAQTARVADTLLFAGVRRVSILDGGVTKWSLENRPLSTGAVTPSPVTYHGHVRENMFVSKEYVASSIGKARTVLLDARDAPVYDGTVIEPFAPRAGHIPTARSLPSPSIWNSDGTYKSERELRTMVVGALGTPHSTEIIVYCGVGGYASGWWFVLTEMLGYRNVKFYDGSAQEWTADPSAPLEVQ